jgi:tetratricopeptide (TPR) repeat protein
MIRQIFKSILFFFLIVISSCSLIREETRPDPKNALLEYRRLRDEWKMEEAYAMIADTCKAFITKDEFVSYNKPPDSISQNQVYNILSIDTLPVFGNKDYARYQVEYQFIDRKYQDTVDGTWYYSLHFENGDWKVIWLSKMLDIAIGHLQNQRYDQALVLFQVITNINPYNDSAFRGLALSYANLSEIEKAVSAAERMINLKPDDPSYYALLADLLGSANRIDESIEYYKKAIEIQPVPMYFVNLGSFYKMNEQYVEADESYRKSLELDSLLPQGWWMLGELYYQHLGDLELAHQYYRKALGLPAMSDFYQQQMYYSYAAMLYDEALEVNSSSLGMESRNLLQEAKSFIGKALALDPHNTDFTFLLHEINQKLEDM